MCIGKHGENWSGIMWCAVEREVLGPTCCVGIEKREYPLSRDRIYLGVRLSSASWP